MKKRTLLTLAVLAVAAVLTAGCGEEGAESSAEAGAASADCLVPPAAADTPVARLVTERGDVHLLLHEAVNPETVGNFIKLAEDDFYDGIGFHRVEPGGVIQAGCPQWNTELAGTGGPGYTIDFENATLPHLEGAVGMARAREPDSAGSQFYICLAPLPGLDGDYVVFGQVVAGMEVCFAIRPNTLIEDVELLTYGEFLERAGSGRLSTRPVQPPLTAPEIDLGG
jgi:peptidyl-prolyl cis-trans isomerase B (cyclophilin B)